MRTGTGVLVTAWTLSIASSAAAQETIQLKNGLSTPITVLIKSAQQDSPSHFHISREGIFSYPLEDAGPYTLQVVPDDQPNSGYRLGSHDLKSLAKAKQGNPVELKGDFIQVPNGNGTALVNERFGVYFEAPGFQGQVQKYGNYRSDYEMEMMTGDLKTPAQPTATSAVIALTVPPDASVLVDGVRMRQKGQVRFMDSPNLKRGKVYWYKVTVERLLNGVRLTETRLVAVQAGETTRVNFLMPTAPVQVIILIPTIRTINQPKD